MTARASSAALAVASVLCATAAGAAGEAPCVSGGPGDALARIVAADYASSGVQSVIFGAWKGTTPLLLTAAGESPAGVIATPAMHIRAGFIQTEALDTVLVKFADEHRVSLDAPLATWFPALPRAADVTLRMLGNSRSGYGDYLADDGFIKRLHDNPFETIPLDDLISVAMRQPMPFAPGTGFHYAHTNAVLLGSVLEKIAAKPLAAVLSENVFGPLHLEQTVIPSSADVTPPAQHVFTTERGFYEDSTYWNPSWATNSGTIVTTVQDVAMMHRAFGSGALVSKAGLAAMVAPTNANSPPSTKDLYLGLGLIVGGAWILNHASVAGSDVLMAYLPDRDLTIVVSTAAGPKTTPTPRGPGVSFLRDAARLLVPERPIPGAFVKD